MIHIFCWSATFQATTARITFAVRIATCHHITGVVVLVVVVTVVVIVVVTVVVVVVVIGVLLLYCCQADHGFLPKAFTPPQTNSAYKTKLR